ncbi:MAG: sigma-70 family RNA polymerase sigma factor [bacterium]|nr:sigma-70 family RNA polymerase sigma factor [bacterium]
MAPMPPRSCIDRDIDLVHSSTAHDDDRFLAYRRYLNSKYDVGSVRGVTPYADLLAYSRAKVRKQENRQGFRSGVLDAGDITIRAIDTYFEKAPTMPRPVVPPVAYMKGIVRILIRRDTEEMFELGLTAEVDGVEDIPLDDDPLADEDDPEKADELREQERLRRKQAVVDALAELPPTLLEPARLFYYEKRTHKEIAVELGISPNAVKQRLHRARKVLKKALGFLFAVVADGESGVAS